MFNFHLLYIFKAIKNLQKYYDKVVIRGIIIMQQSSEYLSYKNI